MKNKMHNKLIHIMLCFVLAFSLTACNNNNNGGQVGTETNTAPPMMFAVYSGNETIIVGENGEEVMRGQNLFLITNTGEGGIVSQYFIMWQRRELAGYHDEYGYPIEDIYSTVYDSNGNILLAEENGYYGYGYEDYISHYPYNYHTDAVGNTGRYIINPFTGEKFEGVDYAEVLESIIVYHNEDSVAYVTDFEGNIPENYPAHLRFSYIEQHGNYYVTEMYEDGSYNTILWDAEFNQLTRVYDYDIDYVGEYFICRDTYNGSAEIYNPKTGEVIRPVVSSPIFYYNDEIYIYRTQDNAYIRRVADDSIIARVNPYSISYRTTQGHVPNSFYYQDGDMIYGIDASGNEFASAQFPNITEYAVQVLSENLLSVRTWYQADNGQRTNKAILVDGNLNIIDTGTTNYSYMELFTTPSGEEYIIAIKPHVILSEEYSTLYDVLDAQGNLILENLEWTRYEGGEYLYVESGFYVGIMRLDGTWVYKASIFTSLEEETGGYYY